MKNLIFILMLLPLQSFAVVCPYSSLSEKKCDLKLKKMLIQLSEDNIQVVSKNNAYIFDFPVQGSFVDWDLVESIEAQGKNYLHIRAWSKPTGRNEEQRLMAYIYEIKDKAATEVFKKDIQARTPSGSRKNFSYGPKAKYALKGIL